MIRSWPVAGVVFGALWVFVRGVDLVIDAVLGQFLLGLLVGMPVAFIFRRMYAEEFDLRRAIRVVPAAVLYVLVFLREIIVANVDVAYRVLAPGMPIEPQVILIPLRVQTDLGVTTIANSITITPGTITLDHDPEENALFVHVIDGRDPAAIVAPIRAWENYALVIFDEERSPDSPAPEITVHPPEIKERLETLGEEYRRNDADPNDGRPPVGSGRSRMGDEDYETDERGVDDDR